ncbi:MAG: PilZ domain-containing protein [Anaerolineae bacterium]|nr:PilZ domain-containing protein [Anaerolineae bacterium]
MMTNSDILKAFHLSMQNKKELKLINSYKGLPISFPASVVTLSGDNVTLKTDRSQIVCMYRDHDTFVQGEFFPETIRAYVSQLDLVKVEAMLSYYEIPKSSFNNRSQIRVEPDNPISGNIKVKEMRIPFRGELADISQGGMGIYIEERLFLPNVYHPGAEITVMISLPTSGKMAARTTVKYSDPTRDERFDAQQSRIDMFAGVTRPLTSVSSASYQLNQDGALEVRGIIVKATRDQAQRRYRLGMKFAPNEATRTMINQFITIRQAEIINEIRTEYNALLSDLQGGRR